MASKKAASKKAASPTVSGMVKVRALKSFASFLPALPGSIVAGRVYEVSAETAAALGKLVELVAESESE